jgi:hypothetical protein
MDLEAQPEQPPEVLDALAALLAPPAREPDPWWQAGLDEQLET